MAPLTGRGGPGRGQGRKKGSKSRNSAIAKNRAIAERIASEITKMGDVVPGMRIIGQRTDKDGNIINEYGMVSGKGGGELPLEYMLRVMNDVEEIDERRDAMATAVASFVHPKLQNVAISPGRHMVDVNGKPIIDAIANADSGKGTITVSMKFDGADDKDIK